MWKVWWSVEYFGRLQTLMTLKTSCMFCLWVNFSTVKFCHMNCFFQRKGFIGKHCITVAMRYYKLMVIILLLCKIQLCTSKIYVGVFLGMCVRAWVLICACVAASEMSFVTGSIFSFEQATGSCNLNLIYIKNCFEHAKNFTEYGPQPFHMSVWLCRFRVLSENCMWKWRSMLWP